MASHFARHGRYSLINPAAYALSTSSIPTCGDGRLGTRRRVESGEPRFKSLGGRALFANGHADGDFECVPVWRFGNSRGEAGAGNRPIAASDSATIYFLGALGRR